MMVKQAGAAPVLPVGAPAAEGLCPPGSGDEEFGVSVWPVQVAVGPAESWVVNCSTSCPEPEAGGLDTTLSTTLRARGPRWLQYEVANTSRDAVLYCNFTCAGQQRSQRLSVTVFREWRHRSPS